MIVGSGFAFAVMPLVAGAANTHTAQLSRDHVLHVSVSGLLTIAGGKWTTYRRMAEDTIDQAATLALHKLIREASLANPLLDVDKLLVIRRKGEANRRLNSHTSDTIKRTGWDNEISELSNLRGKVSVRIVV